MASTSKNIPHSCPVRLKWLAGGSKARWKFKENITITDLYWIDGRREGEEIVEELEQPLDVEIVSLISSQYELIRRVFEYLPQNDLKNAAIAVKDWNHVKTATNTDDIRHEIYWMFWSCASGLELQKFISHFALRRLFSNPKVGIIATARIPQETVHSPLQRYVGDCNVIEVLTGRVIGTICDDTGISEIGRIPPGFSALFLTDVPGTNIHFFSLSDAELRSLMFCKNSIVQKMIEKKFPISEIGTIKAIVFFGTHSNYMDFLKNSVNFIQRNQEQEVIALALEARHIQTWSSDRSSLYGIVFSGKSLNVTCAVLSGDIANVNKTVKLMREKSHIGKQKFALMYSKEDKQNNDWYDRYKTETLAFHECFPSVPMIGHTCCSIKITPTALPSAIFSDKDNAYFRDLNGARQFMCKRGELWKTHESVIMYLSLGH